jgi:hypothetical protein
MGHKIQADADSNLFVDDYSTEHCDLVVSGDSLNAYGHVMSLDSDVATAAKQIDYWSDVYYPDLGYDSDTQIELLKDKDYKYIVALLGIEFNVYILRGSAATLVMSKYGVTLTKLPTLMAMAKTLAKDMITMSSEPADQTTQSARLLSCRKCMFYLPEPKRCVACGCYTELKASFKDAKCPKGNWHD